MIFDAKKDLAIPSILCIKRQVKLLFNYERLKYQLRNREDTFEKRWGNMIEYYEEE